MPSVRLLKNAVCKTAYKRRVYDCLQTPFVRLLPNAMFNPLATRDLAENHVLKLVEGFFGHCRAV